MKLRYTFLLINLLLFSNIVFSQQKFIVVLDAGHGGHDPGCIGQKKTKEKDVNLAVTLKFGDLIEKNCKDVKVIYTRKTDVFVPLINRAQIANNNKSDLFISIHCDAVGNKNNAANAYGVSTFTMGAAKTEANLAVAKRENSVILLEENYETTYQGFDPKSPESYIMFELLQGTHQKQSIELAQCIQTQMKDRAKRHDRSVRQTPALVLKEASMPAVLVEIGFLSNLNEEAYLITQSGQNAIANSLYHGFVNYKKSYDKQNQIAKSSVVPDTKPASAVAVSQPAAKAQPTASATPAKTTATNTANNSQLVYKVQFLTSSTLYKAGATQFKGLKNVEHYKEGNLYKYTYGSKKTSAELDKELKEVKSKFKDAFIIKFQNGKRVK